LFSKRLNQVEDEDYVPIQDESDEEENELQNEYRHQILEFQSSQEAAEGHNFHEGFFKH
jgi:hypothetical protein